MGASHDYETARAEFYGGDAGPSPAPSAPSRSADVLAEFERRLAASQLNSQHPRNFGYFTPPPLLMSIAGEVLAQVTNQGVDVWHAGPNRRVRRGGGRALAGRARRLRPRQLRAADLGRRDGQFHGHGAGPRHPPAEGLRAGPPAPRPRPRGCPRLHLGPDALLDRTGARRAGVPARHAGRDRGRRAVPAPRGAGRGGDRQRPGCRADAARDLGRGGVHEHRRGGRAPRARRRGRAGGPVAPRRRGVRRGGAPLGEAGGPGPRPAPCALGDRRSAQVVLPGLRHRRAAGPRRQPPRADVRRPAARVLPRRRRSRSPTTTKTRGSSASTSSASRARAGGGR